MRDRCFQETSARYRLYKQIHLFDPNASLGAGSPCTALGATRLGMPPYHAELTFDCTGDRPRYVAGRFTSGYLCQTSKAKFWKVVGALGEYRLARDKILASAHNHAVVTAGEGRRAGTAVAGQIVRRRG